MNMTQKAKTIKKIKLILTSLWWTVLILLAVILINVFSAKLSGRVPSIFGYSVMNIVSGSMEDEIPKDSYILIKKTQPENIKKGDVICFYSTDPQIYGLPNTHRVIDEPRATENGIEFVTKGDASPISDTETARGDRLIGVYVKRLDALSNFLNALSQRTVLFVIIGVQICAVSMFAYVSIKSKTEDSAVENGKKTDN